MPRNLNWLNIVFFFCLSTTIVSIVGIFIWIVGDIIWVGGVEFPLSFLKDAPINAGRSGGIRPIITSTFLILFICIGISFPIAAVSGLVFSESLFPIKWFLKPIRKMVDILAGVPSVVFGLFGNTYFCNYLGLGYSILSGGLTLACMILPLTIRITESSFRAVPKDYIAGAEALGLSKLTSFYKILIPATLPQMSAAFVLSIARALAETAALLFTSGYVMRDPSSLLDSGRTLSIHIYDLSMNVTGGDLSAYRSAFVLVVLLLAINVSAHLIIKTWSQWHHGHSV